MMVVRHGVASEGETKNCILRIKKVNNFNCMELTDHTIVE